MFLGVDHRGSSLSQIKWKNGITTNMGISLTHCYPPASLIIFYDQTSYLWRVSGAHYKHRRVWVVRSSQETPSQTNLVLIQHFHYRRRNDRKESVLTGRTQWRHRTETRSVMAATPPSRAPITSVWETPPLHMGFTHVSVRLCLSLLCLYALVSAFFLSLFDT